MTEKQTRGDIIAAWWRENLFDIKHLEKAPPGEASDADRAAAQENRRDNARRRGLAARLRRAKGVDALAEPAVHDLARRLGITPERGPAKAADLMRVVTVLASVRASDSRRLAQRLGEHKNSADPPPLSPLRFQRLLRARDDDVVTAVRRALAVVDYRCHVAALGSDLLSWDHPDWGDGVRTRWCFDYFGAPGAAADADPAHTPAETEQ